MKREQFYVRKLFRIYDHESSEYTEITRNHDNGLIRIAGYSNGGMVVDSFEMPPDMVKYILMGLKEVLREDSEDVGG